ncbi:MAG: PTS sugar transporter subunit IIA [Endomicrobiales bacterium]|nr:PTS sugar transporter subunit IIA [Endomicrobiales bacterium]
MVMHNNEEYLNTINKILKEERVSEIDIIRKKGIGSFMQGSDYIMGMGSGIISPHYDKVLVSVIKDNKKLGRIVKRINEDMEVKISNYDDEGFFCTLPYDKISDLKVKAYKDKKESKIMEVAQFLSEKFVVMNLKGTAKEEVINELGQTMKDSPGIINYTQFIKDVHNREKLATTGIGHGVAMPHARTNEANMITIAIGISKQGVDFASVDGKKAHVVFLIAIPTSEVNSYLALLAKLTRLTKKENFIKNIVDSKDESGVIRLFNA